MSLQVQNFVVVIGKKKLQYIVAYQHFLFFFICVQAMLHVVAGWNGKKGEFKLMVKRSIALVNKSCEFLKDECLVPGSWWVEKNKGMIKDENGEWVIAPVEEEPEPEF